MIKEEKNLFYNVFKGKSISIDDGQVVRIINDVIEELYKQEFITNRNHIYETVYPALLKAIKKHLQEARYCSEPNLTEKTGNAFKSLCVKCSYFSLCPSCFEIFKEKRII